MSTYAIGDIQGCYDSLQRLLQHCAFDPATDRLWLVGDLVNRGPHSLETLRLIKSLGPAAVTVLGNHDLYLIMVAEGGAKFRGKDDTLQERFELRVETHAKPGAIIIANRKVVAHGTPEQLREEHNPEVEQFLKGLPDGPVPFHFPAGDLLQDL